MAIIPRTHKRDGKTVYDVRLLIPGTRQQYTAGTFTSRREAEKCERDEKTKQDNNVWTNPNKGQTPLGEGADMWLVSKAKKKEGSIERDEDTIEMHLKVRSACQGPGSPLGAQPVATIAQQQIQDLVTAWETCYAPDSVVRMHRTVQAIFNWAVDNDFRRRTPCRNIELPETTPRINQPGVAKMIGDIRGPQLERLASALGGVAGNGPMVYLGVQGPRWGEIAGLRVRHVHFGADAHVVIEWQRTRGKKGRMIEGETKSRNSERPLAIPVWLGDMLFDHLSARGGVGDDDYVFVAPEGGALHYGNWRKRFWLPARNRADLPKLRFHDLRRVAATALDEAGVSRAVKQHRIGATEAVVEGIYTGVTDPSDRAAADRVGEMFRPSWAPPAP